MSSVEQAMLSQTRSSANNSNHPEGGAGSEDLRYLELLTPAERQYVLMVKNTGQAKTVASPSRRTRRGSFFGAEAAGLSPTRARSSAVINRSSRSISDADSATTESGASSMSGSPAHLQILSRSSGTRSSRVSPRSASRLEDESDSQYNSPSPVRRGRSSTRGRSRTVGGETEAVAPRSLASPPREKSPIPSGNSSPRTSNSNKPLRKLKGLFRRNTSENVGVHAVSPEATSERFGPGSGRNGEELPELRIS